MFDFHPRLGREPLLCVKNLTYLRGRSLLPENDFLRHFHKATSLEETGVCDSSLG